MVTGSLARRYARALMQMGEATKTHDAIGREIGTLAKAMATSPELIATLSNPAFPRTDRQKIVEALLTRIHASKSTKNFTLLLLERDRMGSLPAISRELNSMLDQKAGRVAAEVTTADPVTTTQSAAIKKSLEKLSGKHVLLQTKQDPELLGGMVAKVGDIVFDGSLKTQLQQMRDQLAK